MVNINSAADRTSIRCHKICKDNRESLNKRLLQELYFMHEKYPRSVCNYGAGN